jgi:hypothetical protein
MPPLPGSFFITVSLPQLTLWATDLPPPAGLRYLPASLRIVLASILGACVATGSALK